MVDFQASEDYTKVLGDEECVLEKNKPNKRYTGNDYFLMRKRGMIRNPEYRSFMAGRHTVYEYSWLNIVRGPMNNDKYNIKEDYYDKGFLAYCSTYNYIAKECTMDKNTVQKYMEEFERRGAIKIIKVGPTPTKRDVRGRLIDRRPSVFILGTWKKVLDHENKEKIQENYWLDDIFYN